MPTYEYHCTQCEHSLEALQKITEEPLVTCPKCGRESLRRGPGGGLGLVFKGSGFYITDYGSQRSVEPSNKTPSNKTPSEKNSADNSSADKSPAPSQEKPKKENTCGCGKQPGTCSAK